MSPREFLAKAARKAERIEAEMDAAMERAAAAFAMIPDAAMALYDAGAELHAEGMRSRRNGREAEAQFHRGLAMTAQRWADAARSEGGLP